MVSKLMASSRTEVGIGMGVGSGYVSMYVVECGRKQILEGDYKAMSRLTILYANSLCFGGCLPHCGRELARTRD